MQKNPKQRLLEVMERLDKTFKPPINEMTDGNWTFLSKDVEVNIDGLKEKFFPNADYVETYKQKINVSWEIIPEIRDYGVKSMSIMVKGISGIIYYEVISKDENAPEEEGQLDVAKYKWEFEERINPTEFGNAIYPTSVKLDFRTMKTIIIF
jgi:hypothetical protein